MPEDGVIVDTSVWIEFFNNPDSSEKYAVVKLLKNNKVFICGMELAEILQGVRKDKEREEIEQTMGALPFLPCNIHTWTKLGAMSANLMKKGLTIPITDLFIAVSAIINNCQVYTLDRHFKKIPGLSLYTL